MTLRNFAGGLLHQICGVAADSAFHPKRIFLVSHMRSGSSLLAHVLSSHPEILGSGELHKNYARHGALARMTGKILCSGSQWKKLGRGCYFLDKILHPHLHPPHENPTTSHRYLLLLREPADTLASIVALEKQFGRFQGHEAERALFHYSERLALLVTLHKSLDPAQVLIIKYEDLTGNPEHVLASVSSHLSLRSPLQNTYQIQRQTGQAGSGDPSKVIFSGKILTQEEKGKRHPPAPSWAVERGLHHYSLAVRELLPERV